MAVPIGPFQNPIKYALGGTKLLALWLNAYHNDNTQRSYSVRVQGLDVGPSNPYSVVKEFDAEIGSATVVNPISNAMLERLYYWSALGSPHEAVVTGGDRPGMTSDALLFFNLRKIKSALGPNATQAIIEISTPATGSDHPGMPITSYWVWYNFGEPFPGVPPDDHAASFSYDSVWGTLAEAEARAAFLNAGVSHHVETETVPGTPEPDRIEWMAFSNTYKGHRDFPSHNGAPDFNCTPVASANDQIGGAPLPAYTVTLAVKFSDLSITLERV